MAEQFQIFDLATHARKKGMWAGALTRTTIPNLDGMVRHENALTVQPIRRDHTPALLKIFDEMIVNATDHERGCRVSAGTSHRIKTFG